ncbi:MAK10-like protein [Tanacetum coccineum]
MGDANPIRTLGDYSKPSYEGYRNTIELPEENNVVPLRFDTIPSNWLERLPAGSISTWEDLTTRSLAQFFPPRRTAKLCNDILMFQQHQGGSLFEAWTRFKGLLQKDPHHGIDLWLQVQIFYDHVNPATRRTIDQSAGGKLRDRNAKESWALLEDLALCDNESWNDPKDFAKPVKAISLSQDVPSTSDRRLIELENQVQRLMEAHLAPKQPIQVNKITSSCEICSGPHDTYYQMKLEKALIDFDSHQERRLSSLEAQLEQNRNPSSPKRVHFVNSVIILNKENEAKESAKSNTTEYKDHEMIVENKEKFEEETEEKTKEEEEDNPEYFEVFPTIKELGFLALGWHLEEIHMTWAHLEKKRTRLRLYTKYLKEPRIERGDGVASIKRRRRDFQSEYVEDFVTASERSRLKVDLEPSTWRRHPFNVVSCNECAR